MEAMPEISIGIYGMIISITAAAHGFHGAFFGRQCGGGGGGDFLFSTKTDINIGVIVSKFSKFCLKIGSFHEFILENNGKFL